MRLYLPQEGLQRVQHSRAQLRSGKRGRGSLGGYGWAYNSMNAGDFSPEACVYNALELAASQSVRVPVLWWDCEYEELYGKIQDYGPSPAQLWRLLDEGARLGQRSGVYSGREWWRARMGGTDAFRGVPFWWADYRQWNSILDVPPYAGVESWAGWQYTGANNQDRSWLWEDVT